MQQRDFFFFDNGNLKKKTERKKPKDQDKTDDILEKGHGIPLLVRDGEKAMPKFVEIF